MSIRPLRFIHAGDFHLERPLSGVTDVPDHLRELFLESPFTAAGRVFEAALVEGANFVVLSGGIADFSQLGPRGPIFLAEQFVRLAERGIDVYWAGSPIDPPESWPAAVPLPRNVHFFPRGRTEGLLVDGGGEPLARLLGTSCDPRRPWRPDEFTPDPAGLYTVAVAHGRPDPAALQARGIDYWALGGRHQRGTPISGPRTVHYCGTPQGRCLQETGLLGCTLVQVDEQSRTRTSFVPADSVRWIDQRLTLDRTAGEDELSARMSERLAALRETMPAATLLISWTLAGRGPLLERLRRASGAAELVERFRNDFGYLSPAAWSLSLRVEAPETLPPEWYEQETIRGDFLRAVRRFQVNADEPLVLEKYLPESDRDGPLAAVVGFCDDSARGRVLSEAAALGADLLTGEDSKE